ncbi:membrane progestin receptor gamma isoform X1 [Manacus candei]|nr:membrane progestin receptor gamma isoform X1 [Manacus candei]
MGSGAAAGCRSCSQWDPRGIQILWSFEAARLEFNNPDKAPDLSLIFNQRHCQFYFMSVYRSLASLIFSLPSPPPAPSLSWPFLGAPRPFPGAGSHWSCSAQGRDWRWRQRQERWHCQSQQRAAHPDAGSIPLAIPGARGLGAVPRRDVKAHPRGGGSERSPWSRSEPSRAMLSLKLPRLLSIHQVPKGYREQGILFGYRPPRSSATDCLLSVFQMTNETLNIWTHFLPAWYFVWTLLGRLQGGWEDPQTWPLLAYLVTCCIYPLASSCAHTFSTMSCRARHLCYFCDYAALSTYSLGSALAYSAYVFPLEWVGSTFHHCYVPVAVFNTVVSTSLSCYSRFLEVESPRLSKAWRTLAFVYPYLFDSIPLFYRLYLCALEGCSEGSILLHYKHTGCALLTCFIFATHLPERLAPGTFDYIGHSHQVFHVCGILGTHFQMEAILRDMAERHSQVLLPSSLQTLCSMGVCVTGSLLVIGISSVALPLIPEPPHRDKSH